jgi:nitroreductase
VSADAFVPPSLDDVDELLQMPLADAMSTQRSIRRLRPDPVDIRIVARCIELAIKAPTGSNGQNWEFLVLTDPAIKARLALKYRRAWPLYRRTLDPAAPGIESMIRMVEHQIAHFESTPVIVVAMLRGGRVPLMPSPPIAKSSYYGSIYPAVQNLLLAARAIGLGASLLTLPLWSASGARRTLGVPVGVMPVCLIAMGWPVGRYGPTTRRSAADVIHIDRYDRGRAKR